ncbi:MAG: 2-amino-4-hydroxy-6-hydroxymethyldihydropteridine diphosphokinase [Gammaproteobacteria bacterium]|nr:2-amino-4-hydroxy-6-hydroxymethyldihydropteridine diphosphokinase [Gammaproteobacteria bacterium]
MSGRVRAYIGLGSNLDDPVAQVRRGAQALARLPDSALVAVSSLYRTPPMGPADQPDFINAVATVDTGLAPEALLDALQAIELAQGRRRTRHWGERTLDLDILLYGDRVIASPRLRVPHPGIARRAFVLAPLAELAPDLCIPAHGGVAALLAAHAGEPLTRLEDPH